VAALNSVLKEDSETAAMMAVRALLDGSLSLTYANDMEAAAFMLHAWVLCFYFASTFCRPCN
jgi:hypothetical protein